MVYRWFTRWFSDLRDNNERITRYTYLLRGIVLWGARAIPTAPMRTIMMGRSLAMMRGSGFRLPIPSFPGLLQMHGFTAKLVMHYALCCINSKIHKHDSMMHKWKSFCSSLCITLPLTTRPPLLCLMHYTYLCYASSSGTSQLCILLCCASSILH